NTRVASDRQGSLTYAVAGASRRVSPSNSSSTRKFRQLLLSNSTPGSRTRAMRGSGSPPTGAPPRAIASRTPGRATASGVAGSARPSDAPTRSEPIRPAAAATCHPSERVPASSIGARGYGYAPGERMLDGFGDPARIDPRMESRSVSFENPTG